ADPEAFSRNMLRVREQGSQVFTWLLEKSDGTSPFGAADMLEATKLFGEVAQFWIANPAAMAETNATLLRELFELAGVTAQRMAGGAAPPVAEPETGDNR